MKLENHQIKNIKDAFQQMKSKEDLLSLLNYAKKNIYGTNAPPFELKQLTYHSNPKVNPNRYTTFKVKKKSGEDRTINTPVKGLMALQKSLNLILQCVYTPQEAATGFIPNKSIVDNARKHAESNYVLNIDLKDFFPSIDQARVWKCFQLKPFYLNEENNRLELANILAALCCTKMAAERKNTTGEWVKRQVNALPQGAPTSPIITNVVCQKLDYLLTRLANRYGLKYSRYADDITFSSMHNVYSKKHKFLAELQKIITSQNFRLNDQKTRLQKSGFKQIVTGLVVNKKANVPKRFIRELRSWIYLWETYSYERASILFENDYQRNKPHFEGRLPKIENVISGKLDYLRMVKGADNSTYQQLKTRFEELTRPTDNNLVSPTHSPKATSTSSTYPIFTNVIYSPKSVADFMSLFNDPEGLKFLTHDYDESDERFDIVSFLKKSHKVFMKNTSSGTMNIPTSLWQIVNQFAFEEKPNWGISITEGWSTSKWIEWSKKEGAHPKKNHEFSSIIAQFRQLTRIESPRLRKICDTAIKAKLEDKYGILNIKLIECEKADFYTNVAQFEMALRSILDGIHRHCQQGETLEISYHRLPRGEYYERIITICHHGSYSSRPYDEILKGIKEGKGDLYEVGKKLAGYCNWSIETKWDDIPVRLNLLRESKKQEEIEFLDQADVTGFKHILTFYYK